jgi:uncharacterized membrane protein
MARGGPPLIRDQPTPVMKDPRIEETTMRIEESIVIHRSPEEVFAFLEIRSNDGAWMASVMESEWLEPAAVLDAPIGIGRRGRMVMMLPGRQAEFIDEVTEYEPGKRIAHRTVNGPIQLNTACICEPAGDGCRTTVVGATEHLPGGLFGRIAAPLVAKVIRRGFRADLARLKKILESEGQADG